MNKEKIQLINKLIYEVRCGDRESLNKLYDIMSPTIWHIALKYLRNQSDAQDVVQQFWADIYKTTSSFLFMQNGFSFLCKVMTRKTINACKKLNRERRATISFVDYSAIEKSTSDDNLENARLKIMVEEALKSLSEIQRIIIQETYFEQKTIREISKELHIPTTTVFEEKKRAIKTLKAIFEKDE